MAIELIKVYLDYELAKLEDRPLPGQIPVNASQKQKWTAPKVYLIELIYAFHMEGVFNNGASELKEIVAYLEAAFDVQLGNYYRTFIEICTCKSEKTRFLDILRERLSKRMDDAGYGHTEG